MLKKDLESITETFQIISKSISEQFKLHISHRRHFYPTTSTDLVTCIDAHRVGGYGGEGGQK